MITLYAGAAGWMIYMSVALSLVVPMPQAMVLRATEKLSVGQMYENLKKFMATAEEYKTKTQKMYKDAKKKKDVMMISCIEPKLKDLSFWTKELAFTVEEFDSARKSEGTERLTFIYQKGKSISEKVEQLFIEASQCVGDEHFISQTSKAMNLQVKGPDFIVDPNQRIPVGTTLDAQESPSINNDGTEKGVPGEELSDGGNVDLTNPDWAGDLIWPEATNYQ